MNLYYVYLYPGIIKSHNITYLMLFPRYAAHLLFCFYIPFDFILLFYSPKLFSYKNLKILSNLCQQVMIIYNYVSEFCQFHYLN